MKKQSVIPFLAVLVSAAITSVATASPSLNHANQSSQLAAAMAKQELLQALANVTPATNLGAAPQPDDSPSAGFGKSKFQRDWLTPTRDTIETWSSFYSPFADKNPQGDANQDSATIVPEPASLVAWSLIGSVCGVGAWKRRRQMAD